MKPFLYLLILSVCLFSCKKGKTLSHQVPVQFITLVKSGVYPKGHFPLSNPDDLTEIPIYPSYADISDTTEIAELFNSKLNTHLFRNNIMLQHDSAEYVLRIESMNLSESLHYRSYTDSCSSTYPEEYTYRSSLEFEVTASLYRKGKFIEKWTRKGKSSESFRLKTDRCNKPKVFPILRDKNCLVDQVAKELRVKISKRMYELEK